MQERDQIFKKDLSKLYRILFLLINLILNNLVIDNEDMHYDFCGKCQEPGKLICCETCSSAYHFECLGYDRVFYIRLFTYLKLVSKRKVQVLLL
jgi:hypothetical protein